MNQTTESLIERPDHPLILSSLVNGTPVFNLVGEWIVHVDELSIEKVSGRTIYAIMSFGGFLGIGEKFHPVPWSLLDYDVQRGGFTVPLDRTALEDAPSYDRAELRNLGGADHRFWDEAIYGYYSPYGAVPYW